jgi:hypothetical protein
MPNLTVFGATEYMDGALTMPVLKELLLRGRPASGRNLPARGRSLVDDSVYGMDDEEAPRRRECRELQALDASGCVSAVFVNALAEFTRSCLSPSDGSDALLSLTGLQRLSFRGARSVAPATLHAFVLACPNLTHLDLSGTRIEPSLLDGLAAAPNMRLRSLGLGRCVRLTGESLHDFLLHAPAAAALVELNLYGDGTFPCPLDRAQLHAVLTGAPCMTSGALRYLDLSSALLDGTLLGALPPQPALRSLGLSHVSALPLATLAAFLPVKMPALEVLTLVGTSPELSAPARQASLALHARLITPLCMPPFSLNGPTRPPPTRLRVLELAGPLLAALGRGAGAWRVVRSKGGRGWYVDTASGWITEPGAPAGLRRDLAEGHPWRTALQKLSDANGNVSSGVGWHARKMEVRAFYFGFSGARRLTGFVGAPWTWALRPRGWALRCGGVCVPGLKLLRCAPDVWLDLRSAYLGRFGHSSDTQRKALRQSILLYYTVFNGCSCACMFSRGNFAFIMPLKSVRICQILLYSSLYLIKYLTSSLFLFPLQISGLCCKRCRKRPRPEARKEAGARRVVSSARVFHYTPCPFHSSPQYFRQARSRCRPDGRRRSGRTCCRRRSTRSGCRSVWSPA